MERVFMAENVGRRGDTWFYRFDLPSSLDGQRHQRRVGGFRTERDAKDAMAKALVAVSQGKLRHNPVKTFGDLATEWLGVIGADRKATTIANYTTVIEAYLKPNIGSIRLDRLSTTKVQQLYSKLRVSGGKYGQSLSGTQVRNIHRVLHNVLGFGQRMGYISTNITDDVERPRDDTAERTIYSTEQVWTFLAATAEDRLAALWYLAISTGLRRAELAGLRWSDVELDSQPPILRVRLTRTTAGNRIVETSPKTKSGKRTLVLDQGSVDALVGHRELVQHEATLRDEPKLPNFVFVDEFGEPFHPTRLTRMLHSIQLREGLPMITLHDLRHTSATVALLAGVHPKVVSERHGHASVQITLDRYSHVLESMQLSAAVSIDKFLGQRA